MKNSNKRKLCFFRSNDFPDEYIIHYYIERDALKRVDCFNHRNGYEDSGYKHYDCEIALMLDIPEDIYTKKERFEKFVKMNYGRKCREDTFLADWGWYEFKDIKNYEEWFKEFYNYEEQRYEKALRDNNREYQTSLF